MIVKHRIVTTEFGAYKAGFLLIQRGYNKLTLEKSGHPDFPVAIIVDAEDYEEFDFLRPDILPPK